MKEQDYPPELLELTSLSEAQLQSQVIEPLLRSLGFFQVVDTSGPHEKGKDLTALRSTRLGKTKLCTIQIKKFRASAKSDSSRSLGMLFNQLRQMLEEPVRDPSTNVFRSPDEGIFITPYPIPSRAFDNFHKRSQDPVFRNLDILHGAELLELIRQKAPNALRAFSLESQYRLSLSRETNLILESAAAFGLPNPLGLDAIYVDATLGQGTDISIETLIGTRFPDKIRTTLSRAKELQRLAASWRGNGGAHITKQINATERRLAERLEDSPKRWRLMKFNAAAIERDKARILSESKVGINLAESLRPVQEHASEYLRELPGLLEEHRDGLHYTNIARSGISLLPQLRRLGENPITQKHLKVTLKTSTQARFRLPSSSLSRLRTHIFILGDPGAGKTTLLRRMTQHAASSGSEEFPMLIRLAEVKETPKGIRDACVEVLAVNRYRESRKKASSELTQLFKHRQILLCLDGLDETSHRATGMLEAIDLFAEREPNCRVVLSSRDTLELPYWDEAFPVRLQPFSEAQLRTFIGKWFSTQPTSISGLSGWLEENPSMLQTARTPLIAALLCSLYDGRAEMPSTEVDLYRGRFDLFLGKWEKAKGILQLPKRNSEQYRRFLMTLAIRMHADGLRIYSHEEALEIAEEYFLRDLHRNAEGLIRDCVKRGLLTKESTGSISFGHLTYQEYMVAEWLVMNDPVEFILSRLKTAWWKKAIDFYAALKADISSLLRVASRYKMAEEFGECINELLSAATLTPKRMRHRLTLPDPEFGHLEYDWSKRVDLRDFL
ncbi:MAG: NACHT domain-containing protein [Deltaproteobacteria bacterium]|nr:NACHT domain-containing protein [Deltaproteobacteria bacterium]